MGRRPPNRPTPGQEGERGASQPNTLGPVSIDVTAIEALNAALGGVQLLSEVVIHIQDAALGVDTAKNNAIAAIDAHVEQKVKPNIDKYAVDAVMRAIQANVKVRELFDTFLAWIRQGA